MEEKILNQKLQNVKGGRYVKMTFESIKEPTEAFKDCIIEKITTGVFRLNIKYANLKVNEGKTEFRKLSGEWVENMENLIFESKGNRKLRIYTTNNKKHKRRTKWLLNGVETTYEYLVKKGILQEKDQKNNGKPVPCFWVKLEHVINIGE